MNNMIKIAMYKLAKAAEEDDYKNVSPTEQAEDDLNLYISMGIPAGAALHRMATRSSFSTGDVGALAGGPLGAFLGNRVLPDLLKIRRGSGLRALLGGVGSLSGYFGGGILADKLNK